MPAINPSTRWSGRRVFRGPANAAAEFQTAWQGLMDSLMDQISDRSKLEREQLDEPARRARRRTWRTAAIVAATVLAALLVYVSLAPRRGSQAVALSTPAPLVTVSQPLQRELDTRAGFLGQFSAIDRGEVRAQVGGTVTA